jgi:hypothetical protein
MAEGFAVATVARIFAVNGLPFPIPCDHLAVPVSALLRPGPAPVRDHHTRLARILFNQRDQLV